ncbi:MAG: recombination regulator RecX [Chloroflexota bacterium]|nr:recombination regulator RecX [Chloroflexota bacterium]
MSTERTARPSRTASNTPVGNNDNLRRDPKNTEATSPRTGSRPSFKWDGESTLTLSAVEPQARNPERVNVYVDGSYAFSLNALLALELHLGRDSVLDPATLKDVFRRDEVGKAVEVCVRLLGYRPRTEAELARRLREKGYDADISSEALDRLRHLGYVDDADFARFWVRNREQFKPMGARRIRSELLQKGVDRQTADEVLEEQLPAEEYETALKAARSKLRAYAGVDYPTFRRRMGGYLARQGFGFDTSARVMKLLWAELAGGATEEEDTL